jgi:molybdopterin molybdotransferase
MNNEEKKMGVNEFLTQLLAISAPLESFDMPLLDAHGATLAEDIFAGERHVLKMGSRIRSTQIGLAASIGLDHLPTRPHPRVVVISAGDDLVEPGHRLKDSEDEYETNSWMLTTAVKEAGAMGYRVHSIPENHEQLKTVVEDQLVRADLIVISGERYDESFDLITAVLSEMGEITTVIPNIEHSGRHNFGTIGPDKTPVITLPGDPISAYLSAELFVRPMIRTMLGAANIHRTVLKAKLTENIESPIGTTSLIRASLQQIDSLTVSPLHEQESLATLSDAQGLIAIAADSPGAIKGEIVDVMVLERAL